MNRTAILAISVLGGLLSATLSLLPLFPIPLLSSLPLFLIGLGMGLLPLYGAGIVACLLVLLLEGPLSAVEFFIFFAVGPSFLIYKSLLKRKKSSGEIVWYPSSLLLRDLTYGAGAVMLIALGFYIYFMQDWDLQTLIKKMLVMVDPEGQLKDTEPLLVKIFPFLPGLVAFWWGVTMLLNGALAQGLLVRFKKNLRPSPSFEDLKVPMLFLPLFGLSVILSFIGVGYLELLGKNSALIFVFPYFFIGLSLIHHWFHKTSYATAGLTVFYFILLLFFWPILIVILLGILKPWIEKSTSSN